ncbi:predicted protein [Nematostella vectensis]|uniref:Selenoprotein W n=1 Tax=Nematostella vectensis TaxID=45351 RepID=A7SKT9_NEMVE|nr:predicted protein [Nematostella vectensis]|eukprot:XP_001627775.1 predicted protein [Nematostella vectensis]
MLKSTIQAEFSSNEVEVTSYATPNVTGYFEVSVNDQLVHSKKNGDGYVDSEKKLAKIFDSITKALG